MNSTSAILDRDDTGTSNPGTTNPGTPVRARHARPSRARRWLIGSGAVVVGRRGRRRRPDGQHVPHDRPAGYPPGRDRADRQPGRAQPPEWPLRQPRGAQPPQHRQREPGRAPPAEHPGRQPGRPVHPRSGCRHLGRVVKHVVNRAVSRVAEMMGRRSDVPATAASEGTGDRPPRCPPTSRQASNSDAAPWEAASERPDGDLGRCAERPVDLRV